MSEIRLAHTGFYSVYTKSLDFYNVPFYASSDKEALNVIRNSIFAGADIAMKDHLDDLSLYRIGSFDSDTGMIIVPDKPIFIYHLSDIPLVTDTVIGGESK